MTSSLVGSEMCIRDRSLDGDALFGTSYPSLLQWTAFRGSSSSCSQVEVEFAHGAETLPIGDGSG
eukprot:8231858-Prorocentrum_lima.AAC.1